MVACLISFFFSKRLKAFQVDLYCLEIALAVSLFVCGLLSARLRIIIFSSNSKLLLVVLDAGIYVFSCIAMTYTEYIWLPIISR